MWISSLQNDIMKAKAKDKGGKGRGSGSPQGDKGGGKGGGQGAGRGGGANQVNNKDQFCRFYLKGTCTKGDYCTYLHDTGASNKQENMQDYQMPPHGQGMQSPAPIADSIYQPQNDYMHPVEQSMM